MEEYPIIIDGVRKGTLKACPDGLFTLFEAEAETCSELLRLSVYGTGGEGYLGIMEPMDGGLYLKRRFTQAAMRDFPREIEYAGIAGQPQTIKPTTEKESEPETQALPEQLPPEPSDDLLWFSTPEGVLTAFDGEKSLLAIPADVHGAPSGIIKTINGREYVVFPGKSVHK